MATKVMRFFKDERGGAIIILGPYLVGIMFLMAVLFLNSLIFSYKKDRLQILADSASRAGALAVSKSYAVRERTGHGYDDYHVYTELDSTRAIDLSTRIVDDSRSKSKGIELIEIEENPSGDYMFPVWNNRRFCYEDKNLNTVRQYKNGNFSIRLLANVETPIKGFFGGIMDARNIEIYSQSMAKGKVIHIR